MATNQEDLNNLYALRAQAQAKLAAIMADDTGFDSALEKSTITAATDRYCKILESLDAQITAAKRRLIGCRRLNVVQARPLWLRCVP